MVTTVNNLNLSQLQSLNERSLSQLLKVGQQLNVSIEKIEGQQVQLRLGNQTLNALSDSKMLNLGPAKIQVTQTEPQIMVTLLKPEGNNEVQNKALAQQLAIQNALRQLLPNQATLTQTLTQLSQIPNLPSSLQVPLQTLLEQIKKPLNNLSGKELKASIENSGLFLESKIKTLPAGKNASLQTDLKAMMAQLLQQTQSSSTQSAAIKQLSEGLIQAINRITSQQLQQLENPLGLSLQILRDIDSETVEERMAFKRSSHANNHAWQVWLQIELPQGKMQAKVHLTQNRTDESVENKLLCLFWCEEVSLLNSLKETQDNLKESLSLLGIDQLTLSFSENALSFDQELSHSKQISLIDIKI